MSSKEGEVMDVSMVTEVVGEPQKEQSDLSSTDITTLTSSDQVAMETASAHDTVEIAQERRYVSIVCKSSTTKSLCHRFIPV